MTGRLIASLFVGIACALPVGLSAQNVSSNVRGLFVSWAPISVESMNGTLTLKLPQRRITDDIYYTIIQAGFCLGPFFDADIEQFNEVIVLNEFGVQGWVFEGGGVACAEINETPGAQVRLLIAAQTHLF